MARRALMEAFALFLFPEPFGLSWLCIIAQVRMGFPEDVANGIHVRRAYAVAQVGDVAGDPVRVLVAAAACDGFGDELFSVHESPLFWSLRASILAREISHRASSSPWPTFFASSTPLWISWRTLS